MNEQETLTLHRPESLHQAIAIMTRTQGSVFTARPLIGAALAALDQGDVGDALILIDGARTHTITGKGDAAAVAALIRQAFDI